MINILDLTDKINALYDEILDPCLNIVDTKWAFQHRITLADGNKKTVYWPPKCPVCKSMNKSFDEIVKCKDHIRELTQDHLLEHFQGKPIKEGKHLRGALGFSLNFKDKTKLLVIDFDSSEAVKALQKQIAPVLREYEVDYIVEHGPGDLALQKCHLWIKTDLIDFITGYLFLCALLRKAGLTPEQWGQKGLKLELYPKKNSYIRLFGGYHTTRGCVYPVYRKGKSYYKTLEMIDQFLDAKKLEEGFIVEFINQNTPEEVEKKTDRSRRWKTPDYFKIIPKNLFIPDDAKKNITPEMEVLASNCQAINGVINDAYGKADILGFDSEHEPGLFLGGACSFLDQSRNRNGDNVEWFETILDDVRIGSPKQPGGRESAESNQWTNPDRSFFVKCSSWKGLGYCKGCKFTNHSFFESPLQLLPAKKIRKTKLYSIDFSSVEETRSQTVQKAFDRATECINQNIEKNIVIASFPGSGKSYSVDKFIYERVAEGQVILLAVHTADAAQQHKKRLEELWGVRPFIINSHKQLFTRNPDGSSRVTGYDRECPPYSDIQRLADLGVSSKVIRKQFCRNCPFLDDCPYPGQYSHAGEPKFPVVIIQHAHFSCQEILFTLLSEKSFDCLIIDEEFVKNTYTELKPNRDEIARLKEIRDNYIWVDMLVNWLEGIETPETTISPSEEDLFAVREHLEELSMPWNIPTYILYFNQGKIFNKERGLFVFYPLPEIPVKIFTDATPPREMLEIVLDTKNIEYFGENEVLDYTLLNKNTKIRQVLDSKTTKSELAKDDFALFYEWLEFIGDEIRERHKGKKILITTYKDEKNGAYNFFSRTKEWLERNYPDIFVNSEIVISWMVLGTNEYALFQVQYQLAGLHYNTKQLYEAVYQLKSIHNWHNRINGRPTVENMYHSVVDEQSKFAMRVIPLRRVEFDPIEGPGMYEYEFDPVKPSNAFFDIVPEDWWMFIVWKLSLAKRQQAMRIIRCTDDLPREVTIADKSIRETQAVRESFLIDEYLGYLR